MANQWDTLGRTFHTSCVREQIFLYIIFTGFHLGLNVMSCVVLSCCNTDLFDLQDARSANLALGLGPEERFFNKLEDDVSRIIQQEKRREQYSNSQGQEVNTSTEHEPVSRPVQIIKNTCTNLQYMNKPCTNFLLYFLEIIGSLSSVLLQTSHLPSEVSVSLLSKFRWKVYFCPDVLFLFFSSSLLGPSSRAAEVRAGEERPGNR